MPAGGPAVQVPLGETERAACEELAAAPGSEFEVIRRFIPGHELDGLLALEALFKSLREVPLTVSDPSVGAAKLAWWQRELARAPDEGSQHPVVNALRSTDMIERVRSDAFHDYLHALVFGLQDESVSDLGALEARLRHTAGREAQLLAGLDANPLNAIEAAGIAARLSELLRTLARPGGRLDWLPLDLVARHRFERGVEASDTARAALVGDLAHWAQSIRASHPLGSGSASSPGWRYLALRDALVSRRLQHAARRPAAWLGAGHAPRIGDVFTAWRAARRLYQREGTSG